MAGLPQLTLLLQGGVVVGRQLGGQLSVQSCAFLGGAAWNRSGSQCASLAPLAEIPLERRQGDVEDLHDLLAWGALIHGSQDALT